MIIRLSVVVVALALAGCSRTLPVSGRLSSVPETFTGEATGYMDGSGNMSIITSEGTSCTGDFVYTSGRKGEGVFACDDGRSGPFWFASTGSRGTGYGTLEGEKFTFTFGD